MQALQREAERVIKYNSTALLFHEELIYYNKKVFLLF